MRIRFFHLYFHPDVSSVSQIISQLAFYLSRQGDDVSVVCSRNRYDGSSGVDLPARENIHGVEVERVWGPSLGRGSLAARILDMASFCFLAVFRGLLSRGGDVVVFLTNPPLFAAFGAVLKKVKGDRFVYVVMDVYPDIAVNEGVLRHGSLFERMVRSLSRIPLRSADRIVVLGEDMRKVIVSAGAKPEKVAVVRNWGDPDAIFPILPEENRLREAWGLKGKFVVEYSGNFGVSHSFDDLLAVAGDLSGKEDIRFVFIGGGIRRREVEEGASKRGLRNVLLFPYQDVASLPMSLSAGDVHYVSLREDFEGLVVPSKAYGIMAAGRPMIYQGSRRGEIYSMIEREGLGYVVAPGDRDGLREAILALYRNPEERIRMGAAARKALEERYSAAIGLARYREVIRSAVTMPAME